METTNGQHQPTKQEPEQEEERNKAFTNVEVDRNCSRSHNGATPLNSDAVVSSSEQPRNKPATATAAGAAAAATIYGMPIRVTTTGEFPAVGSILGPYFCLGRLGKGTFSSIHKCINLQYFHRHQDATAETNGDTTTTTTNDNNSSSSTNACSSTTTTKRRIAAAKVELSDFQQSGVLESEATILDFLHRSLPPGTVPVYMGHYKCDKYAAILMEYLPGDDMHQLREQVMAGGNTRRVSLEDAVYLSAHVLLPLLEQMHRVGMVHRDVKPSNCVRSSESSKDFCLVDFGLSKSIVVPHDSEFADPEHLWSGEWLKPQRYTGKGAYRQERKQADFRGTSMYASLRVHQGKDYCPRDDIWSLLYVFCDLVSGGLPWMSHAANRDRAGCQEFKERVHGERMSAEGEIYDDETSLLLMGDIYHIAAYREQKHKEAGGDPAKIPPLPEPLAMSKDGRKVELLRKAFKHLSRLRFHEMPDYELVRECITGFLPEKNEKPTDPFIRPIRWVQEPKSPELKRRHVGYPEWELFDKHDPVATDDFRDAENELQGEPKPRIDMTGRLPVKFQFRVAQMKQNSNHEGFPPHQILSDWMQVVSPLLYKDWDARKFEDGGHRTSTDGFRRARYLELLEDCLACARKHGSFRSREFFYHPADDKSVGSSANGNKKRRVVLHCVPEASKQAPMAFVSKVLYGLQNAITAEKAKKPPPPMRISFS